MFDTTILKKFHFPTQFSILISQICLFWWIVDTTLLGVWESMLMFFIWGMIVLLTYLKL